MKAKTKTKRNKPKLKLSIKIDTRLLLLLFLPPFRFMEGSGQWITEEFPDNPNPNPFSCPTSCNNLQTLTFRGFYSTLANPRYKVGPV